MRKRTLGRSGISVSEVGFGCMSIGTDKAVAVRLLHEAMDLGINFFDTADLYDQGQNEEIVGQAIRDRRHEVVIATKVGNRFEKGKPGWTWDASGAYIRQAVENSLKRLGVDFIDLYQLHGGTMDDPIDETIETFESLVRAGWIRAYGISSIRPNVIRTYIAKSNITSVMMQYSILDRRPEEAMLDLLLENDIGVIGRGPVARGLLSDKTLREEPTEGYLDHTPDEIARTVRNVSQLALPNRSIAQTALKYSLHHPAVSSIIPGASRSTQLIENAGCSTAPDLTDDEVEQIRIWSKQNVYTAHRD